MLEAEKRNRTAAEDLLVGHVFGAIAKMEVTSLASLMHALRVDVVITDRPRIVLWPKYLDRTPDIVIASGRRWHVAVEAKLDSRPDVVQLVDEYREGRHQAKDTWLVLLSGHAKAPKAVREANATLRDEGLLGHPITWCSWAEIHRWLASISRAGGTEGRLAADAMAAIDERSQGAFVGFSTGSTQTFARARAASDELAEQLRSFFASLEHDVHTEFSSVPAAAVWERDDTSRLLGSPLMPTWVGCRYVHRQTRTRLWVRYVPAIPALLIGGDVVLNRATLNWLRTAGAAVADDLRRLTNGQVVLVEGGGGSRPAARPTATVTADDLAPAALVRQTRFDVVLVIEGAELRSPAIMATTRKRMRSWATWATGSTSGLAARFAAADPARATIAPGRGSGPLELDNRPEAGLQALVDVVLGGHKNPARADRKRRPRTSR